MRVIEEIDRFCFDNKTNMVILKQFRHTLSGCEIEYRSRLPLIKTRNSAKDVGTSVTTKEEIDRKDLYDVQAGNFKRIEESLRVIEEIGKLVLPELTELIKSIRYKCYEIEQAVTEKDNKC